MLDIINYIFNNKIIRTIWLKIRYPITLISVLFLIPFVKKEWFLTGFIVSLVGEVIQLWCFASLAKQKKLCVQGLYALCRNPMYIGRFFVIAGLFITAGIPGILLLAPVTIIYYLYMINRVKREEEKLKELFGKAYEDYCTTTNRFIPTIKSDTLHKIFIWDWNLFFINHGHWNFILLIAIFFVLWSSQYINCIKFN